MIVVDTDDSRHSHSRSHSHSHSHSHSNNNNNGVYTIIYLCAVYIHTYIGVDR